MSLSNGPYMDFISGLPIAKASASSFSVGTGGAYIPALSRGITLDTASTVTCSGMTAGSTYYIYLYMTSDGVVSVEYSTTAPVTYFGTAQNKNGDTTRRLIGSFVAASATDPGTPKGLLNTAYATAAQGTKADTAIQSDAASTSMVSTIWVGTQAQYNAITTPVATTLYIING